MAILSTPQPLDIEGDDPADVRELKSRVRRILGRADLSPVVDKAVQITTGPSLRFLFALRSPRGFPRQVPVAHEGIHGCADVNPQGRVDYVAELRAWVCVCHVLLQRRAA